MGKKKAPEKHGFNSGMLRAVMAELRLSNEALGKRMKKTPTTISNWRNDVHKPKWDDLVELGKALGKDYRIFLT